MEPDAPPPDDTPAAELVFNFRSARLSLAFVATVGERWRRNTERLRAPSDLARWYREVGLLEETIPVTPTGLDRARSVREAVHQCATALIAGRPATATDTAVINAAAAAAPLVPSLRNGRRVLTAPAVDAESAALSTVARDAIDLFTGAFADRVRECESHECGLLFVDTSRPGRRRWCSSGACGSRDRSAAYRRRRQADPRT